MVIYDPRGMTWDTWCKLMCELFASQQLVPTAQSNWRSWAAAFLNNGSIAAQGAPDPRGFASWDLWAKQLVGTFPAPGVTSNRFFKTYPTHSAAIGVAIIGLAQIGSP